MTDHESALGETFFHSYQSAFQQYDAAAILAHFAFPCHVASDTGQTADLAVYSHTEWSAVIERLLAMYRAVGMRSTSILRLQAAELSPRLRQVQTEWALQDAAGARLYSFDSLYTVVHTTDGERIAAIAHNEIPRYRECVERLKSSGHAA